MQLLEALRYKPEGHGFDSRWCQWNFWLILSFRPHYGSGADSAFNRNEYQEYFLGVKAAGHKNIVNYIKAQRLSWFGHVQRMSDTRTVKKIFNWKPLTKISQGRPKYRWEDNIKEDICQMKIRNWTACVQDREKWKKEVVEKARTISN